MSVFGNFFNNLGMGFGLGMYMNSPFFGGFCSPFGFNNPFMCGCGFYPYAGFTAPSLFSMPFPSMNYAPMSNFSQSTPTFTLSQDFSGPAVPNFTNLWGGASTQSMSTDGFQLSASAGGVKTTSSAASTSSEDEEEISSSEEITTNKGRGVASSTRALSSSSTSASESICYDANQLKSKWHKKKAGLSNEFYNKVINISKKINCDPNHLMAMMYSESRLNHTAVNRNGGAKGLIQFMPNTAEGLGTTTTKLKAMTPEKQLDYVEKYFVQQKRNAGFGNQRLDKGTLYAICFLPKYAKHEVLCKRGTDYYAKNKGLDLNHDGKITKTELGQRLNSYLA